MSFRSDALFSSSLPLLAFIFSSIFCSTSSSSLADSSSSSTLVFLLRKQGGIEENFLFVMNILDEPGKMSDLRVVGGSELLVELDDNPETEGGTALLLPGFYFSEIICYVGSRQKLNSLMFFISSQWEFGLVSEVFKEPSKPGCAAKPPGQFCRLDLLPSAPNIDLQIRHVSKV